MTRSGALIAALLLVGGSASAQPITAPEQTCNVTVALAPDDVRAEIEAWVRAEPRCVRELEVRAVPTEDGLYLSATDPRGHVRERVVPDAQAAAVLVVSWMADDSLGGRLPAHVTPPPPEATPVASSDDEVPREVMAPGLVRSVLRRDAARGQRWLTLGAIGASNERAGGRASIDVLAGRTFSIGLAGGWQRGERDQGSAQARLVIGASHAFGRVTLRAQLGFGIDVSRTEERMGMTIDRMDAARGDDARIQPALEAALLAKVSLTGAWGLVGGPMVTALPDAHAASGSIFLGVQHGL